jgi:hypothetical protein
MIPNRASDPQNHPRANVAVAREEAELGKTIPKMASTAIEIIKRPFRKIIFLSPFSLLHALQKLFYMEKGLWHTHKETLFLPYF